MTLTSQKERQKSNMKQDVSSATRALEIRKEGPQPWLHIRVNSPRRYPSATSRNSGQLVWAETWSSVFF